VARRWWASDEKRGIGLSPMGSHPSTVLSQSRRSSVSAIRPRTRRSIRSAWTRPLYRSGRSIDDRAWTSQSSLKKARLVLASTESIARRIARSTSPLVKSLRAIIRGMERLTMRHACSSNAARHRVAVQIGRVIALVQREELAPSDETGIDPKCTFIFMIHRRDALASKGRDTSGRGSVRAKVRVIDTPGRFGADVACHRGTGMTKVKLESTVLSIAHRSPPDPCADRIISAPMLSQRPQEGFLRCRDGTSSRS
jgi:hypothetical protein